MILRENGELSVSETATHAVAKTPTITKAAYKLQLDGMLTIFTNVNDARVSMMKLTDKGRQTVDSLILSTSKVFDRAYEGFTFDEIDDLNAKLHRLFSNLEGA